MTWKRTIFKYYESKIQKANSKNKDFPDNAGVHLAIFIEPFFSLLFSGKKTIESRFSINNVAPFRQVYAGDLVFIKKSGGPISGYFIVGKVHYYAKPSTDEQQKIELTFGKGICTEAVQDFWERRSSAHFISIFEIKSVVKFSPLIIDKKDRRAWAVIKLANSKELLS